MGLFDKLKKSPEQEAKYQARLAEIRAKRGERLDNVQVKRAENHTKQQERLVNTQPKPVESKQIVQDDPPKQPSAFKAFRDERKAEKSALADTRGKELGYVAIAYIGGYDDQKRFSAKLRFYEKQIEYSQLGKPVKGLVINASDIKSIEIGGQQQTTSRLSVTRMATLGVFSLAAPKRTKIKDTSITIGLKDGRQILFHTKELTEFEVHSKLANAVSYYHQLQASQNQQTTDSPTAPTDNAAEIMKYSTLLKRGMITQEEYQAKKRQLLGL
jgi:hypothetical protein